MFWPIKLKSNAKMLWEGSYFLCQVLRRCVFATLTLTKMLGLNPSNELGPAYQVCMEYMAAKHPQSYPCNPL